MADSEPDATPDESETVLVVTKTGGSLSDCYHTDPECQWLARTDSDCEKPLSVLPADIEQCKFCAGTAESSQHNPWDSKATRRQLEALSPEDVGLSPLGERSSQRAPRRRS